MSQKTNSMIKLALVFFVSLLSFSIGTYVGKKYSDNQHKLAALEPKKNTNSATPEEYTGNHEALNEIATTEATVPHTEKKGLSDTEVAKIAEEFANDQAEPATEEKSIQTAENEEKEIKTISTHPTAAPKVTKSKPVTAETHAAETTTRPPTTAKALTKNAIEQIKKMDTEREPASLHPSKEIIPMHFTVQVGSFPTEAEAKKMTNDLQNKGYKTSFVSAQVNGQTWYRVNVGLFGTVKEAQDYKKDFLEKTRLSSAIVQKVQN